MLVSNKAIGRNIRQARTQLHLTQQQAAEKIQLSQLHFGRLERGERPASLEQLACMAKAFDVTMDDLLSGCVIEESLLAHADADLQVFKEGVSHLAEGCTPKARKLMLTLCQAVAQQDKSNA